MNKCTLYESPITNINAYPRSSNPRTRVSFILLAKPMVTMHINMATLSLSFPRALSPPKYPVPHINQARLSKCMLTPLATLTDVLSKKEKHTNRLADMHTSKNIHYYVFHVACLRSNYHDKISYPLM